VTTVAMQQQQRRLGAGFGVSGLISLALLMNHPGSNARDFSAVLADEAAHRVQDGIVHGGFVFTLALLMTCFVLLRGLLKDTPLRSTAATVAFCTGCALLMASMVVDGFAIPAIATRYLATAPTDLATAKGLFVLCGALIGALMPLGLAFQSLAILCVSSALVRAAGARRITGVFGLAAAVVIIGLLCAAPSAMTAYVLMGGIALVTLWYVGLAVTLWREPAVG
jgi:hypothetical protein